jgi:hypothetical protein
VALLPFLDQQPVYNNWNTSVQLWNTTTSINGALMQTILPVWACPSSVGGNAGGMGVPGTPGGPLNLVIVPGGVSLKAGLPPTPGSGWTWKEGVADYIWVDGFREATLDTFAVGSRNGIFNDTGLGGANAASMAALSAIGQQKLSAKIGNVIDGLSNTFALFEKAGRNNVWVKGKIQTTASAITTMGGASGQVAAMAVTGGGGWGDIFNYEWVAGVLPAGYDAGNGGLCVVNCNNVNESGIYAFHPGGGHALLGDGSVHFISASVDAGAFAAACSQAGGETRFLQFN